MMKIKRRVELTALNSQNENLQRTVSDLKSSVSQLEQDLSSSQSHASELSSSLAEKDTALTLVGRSSQQLKGRMNNYELKHNALMRTGVQKSKQI
jgi:predicted  nucleic acid-binding Zn-ribbon protein